MGCCVSLINSEFWSLRVLLRILIRECCLLFMFNLGNLQMLLICGSKFLFGKIKESGIGTVLSL